MRVINNTKWFDFCKKHKWADWIDDNIFWYLIDKPLDIYTSIKYWFVCNWNKEHWKLVKTAFTSYGWDYSFLNMLEEAQIDKQLKYFSKHQIMIDEQYEQLMRSLKWAKYCIHLINNDTDLYHYTGDIYFEEKENSNLSEIKTDTLEYHYDGPRVNKRNIRRFITEEQYNHINSFKDDMLYMIKLKHLYYRIREIYSDYWWD